jgi:outer membrane protein assembly factor BamD
MAFLLASKRAISITYEKLRPLATTASNSMKRALVFALICLWLTANGCGTKKRELLESQEYYAQGNYLYETGDYDEAKKAYQHLIEEYPFSPYTEEAELKIALANYQLKDYVEASTELEDFERMHPTSSEVALAQYYLAMCYEEQVGRPDQDQRATANALVQFEMLERRFPESPFAELAHERIQVLREVLARNIKYIGEYYYRRGNFRAAESRFAELLQKFPDTPVAPETLFELGETLAREGKKYSAAQAFAAFKWHYPDSFYAKRAAREVKSLRQPIDTDEDSLALVLAETGFPATAPDPEPQILASVNRRPAQADGTHEAANEASAAGMAANRQTTEQKPPASPAGPVTLRGIRLASSNPPLSVVLDLTGPVDYDKSFEKNSDSSELTVRLRKARPDPKLESHIVFNRSIFKDCDVETAGEVTTVTVRTGPVANYAVIPLEGPARLMVTYTPSPEQLGELAKPALQNN